MGLYVSTNRNHNPFNCKNFHNEKIDANANKDKHIKEPFFFFL
jgi:DNA-directed RNA polymerase subunit beta'